jgi:hypothetical protein
MQMPTNFADVANTKVSEIERPPLPPVGTYRWQITKLPAVTTSGDGKWDILTVLVRALEAQDDVDMTDYAGEVTNITNQLKFMFNKEDEVEFEKSLFRAKTFFVKHVKCADDDDTVSQMLNKSVNQQFLGSIAWQQDKNDPEIFYANVARTAPLD